MEVVNRKHENGWTFHSMKQECNMVRHGMQLGRSLRLGVLVALGLVSVGGAQVDSSSILFADDSVRQYQITFYDANWKSTLEAYWSADSGCLPARFSDGTTVLDSVGVRYKGNSSYSLAGNSPKKPFKVKFDEYKDQTYYGVKVLNFSNGIGDPSFLREKISYDVLAHYFPTPRSSFATIAVGDTAIGLYTQVEQEDKGFLKRFYPNAKGNLFKAGDDGATLAWLGADSSLYFSTYELKTNETANDWSGLLGFVNAMGPDSATFCAEHRKWIDPDNVTKLLAFNMVFSNFDSYTGSGRNFYLYQVADSAGVIGSKIDFIPWDVNLSFGAYTNNWNVLTQDLLTQSNAVNRPLVRRVLECDSLKWAYLYWVKTIIGGYGSTSFVQSEIDRLAPVIRPYVNADANKFYTAAAFESNLTTNYKSGPTASIPGLVAFSNARDSILLAQVAGYLPASYVRTAVQRRTALPSVSLRRLGGQWILSGLEPLGEYRLEWFHASGRRLGSRIGHGSDGAQILVLPVGMTLVRVVSSQGARNFSVPNL